MVANIKGAFGLNGRLSGQSWGAEVTGAAIRVRLTLIIDQSYHKNVYLTIVRASILS